MLFGKPMYLILIVAGGMTMGIRNAHGQETILERAAASDSTHKNSLQIVNRDKRPTIYGHVTGGIGFSYMAADDVLDIMRDGFGVGLGVPLSYGVRVGFRNIVQVEYSVGSTHHNLNNNSMVDDIPNEVVKMDYGARDIQFKLNPKFWKRATPGGPTHRAFFLVYGFGDVEWLDRVDNGFKGKTTIYGIEYAMMSKSLSVSFGLKRYGIKFDDNVLPPPPAPFVYKSVMDASDNVVEFKIGFGVGL